MSNHSYSHSIDSLELITQYLVFTKLIALQYHHRSFEAIQNPSQRDGCVEVDNCLEAII